MSRISPLGGTELLSKKQMQYRHIANIVFLYTYYINSVSNIFKSIPISLIQVNFLNLLQIAFSFS